MKNKYIIIGIVLIVFLGFNYNNFINFYYNSFGDYSKTNNLVGKYNLGTDSYIKSNYEDSINSFSGILDDNNSELNFRVLHNIANSFFKFGENKDLNERINLFTKSVDNYREALNIKFDEQTQKNLEFVLEQLRIAKLEQEKEKKEKEDDYGKENENKNKGDNKKNESEEGGENQELGDSEGGKQLKNNEGKLSEETKKLLEQKEVELEKLQEEIGKYYNKNYKEEIDPFNDFNNFFDNSSFNNDSEEKDW